MQALIERHHVPRINGFPSTISEINKAKSQYFKVRDHQLELERTHLTGLQDDDLFEKLVKNYDRKAKKEFDANPDKLLARIIKRNFQPPSYYRKKVPVEDRKRCKVSDMTKAKIFADADNGADYDQLSKKFGLKKDYLYSLFSRRQYQKDLPLFSPKNINRHRKVDAEAKLIIKHVSLSL